MSVTSKASQKCVTGTKNDGNLLLEKNSVQNSCPCHFRRCFRFELGMIFSPEKYFRFKVFLLLENVHLKIFLLFFVHGEENSVRAQNFSNPGVFLSFCASSATLPGCLLPFVLSVSFLKMSYAGWSLRAG